MSEETLADVGERRLLREVVVPEAEAAGDDCAVVGDVHGIVLASTDPVPEPAAALIAADLDPFWKGWLLVTINASDLAAGGAYPLSFLGALEAPPSLSVNDLRRLILGIKTSCQRHDLRYIGGNLREGPRVTGTGTAIGVCKRWLPLSRIGAKPGDVVASVGQGGVFWRDALRSFNKRENPSDRMTSPLFAPTAQVQTMWRLAELGLVHAAMDNSDGLLPTLQELAIASGVTIEVQLEALSVPDAESTIEDPARLWLGWGDWNCIVFVSPANFDEATAVCRGSATPLIRVGECIGEGADVLLTRAGITSRAPRFDSERFVADSWFRTGITTYIETLLSVPLP